MTPNEYQKMALKTLNPKLTKKEENGFISLKKASTLSMLFSERVVQI